MVKHKPIDATGRLIRIGDTVKVVGVPDLGGMAPESVKESLPVFEYLVGKYKRVEEFDDYGFAWLRFLIRDGPSRGRHFVAIEPFLLRVRRSKGVTVSNQQSRLSQPTRES